MIVDMQDYASGARALLALRRPMSSLFDRAS
jgi:hypothetical protein